MPPSSSPGWNSEGSGSGVSGGVGLTAGLGGGEGVALGDGLGLGDGVGLGVGVGVGEASSSDPGVGVGVGETASEGVEAREEGRPVIKESSSAQPKRRQRETSARRVTKVRIRKPAP